MGTGDPSRHRGNRMGKQRATATHLLEGLKSRTPTTPEADAGQRQQEISVPVGGQSHTHTSEGSLAVSYKMKHVLTVQSNIHASRHLPKMCQRQTYIRKPARGCLEQLCSQLSKPGRNEIVLR